MYLLICAGMYVFQGRLLYLPSPDYTASPADIGLEYEDLTLTAADGVAIAAWYIPCRSARGHVIFCHGNAGNMADRLTTLGALHRLGLNVLIFDYRGYGRSGGSPAEQGTYLDAEAAWNHLIEKRGVSPGTIVIFGRSLGGAVAIELARRRNPAALVVESTFTNVVDIGRRQYPFLPINLLCRYRYDSLAKVGQLAMPKLFLHGRDDQLIPIEVGHRLFEAAAEPKQFIETPGGHNFAGFTYTPEYTARLALFLDLILGP
ncbi:MAG: alpha/beta hydrolase [Phycisphaerae bacterium]